MLLIRRKVYLGFGDRCCTFIEGQAELVLRRVDGNQLVLFLFAVEIKSKSEYTAPRVGELAAEHKALIAGKYLFVAVIGARCQSGFRRTKGSIHRCVKFRNNAIHRYKGEASVCMLENLLRDNIARPASDIHGRGRIRASCPAYHIGVVPVIHMFGRIEQLAIQSDRGRIGTKASVCCDIPKCVILAGVRQVPFAPDSERIAALQIPELAGWIGENNSVVLHVLQVLAQCVLQDSCRASLVGGDCQ